MYEGNQQKVLQAASNWIESLPQISQKEVYVLWRSTRKQTITKSMFVPMSKLFKQKRTIMEMCQEIGKNIAKSL